MDLAEHYAPIIEQPTAFREACETPLPTVIRHNQLQVGHDRLLMAFEEETLNYAVRTWNPRAIAIDTDQPGKTWPYQHGWIHGQEEISQLPPLVLSPEPGDIVWDAAAAPGGKATQLAAMVHGNGGYVVANDVNLGRISALRSNADRLGVDNLIVTNQDARHFSVNNLGVDHFDATLVDAPCSGEGTCRKHLTRGSPADPGLIASLVSVQRSILERAIELTRPGGTVVYSTCTFAPPENEGVVSQVLGSHDCRLVPYETPLSHRQGVTSWEGTQYPPEVNRIKRFYPHHNNTGGFVCAKLRVTG